MLIECGQRFGAMKQLERTAIRKLPYSISSVARSRVAVVICEKLPRIAPCSATLQNLEEWCKMQTDKGAIPGKELLRPTTAWMHVMHITSCREPIGTRKAVSVK